MALGYCWQFPLRLERHRARAAHAKIQTDIVREVLAYGHLLFIASVIVLAAGLAEVVAHPGTRLDLDIALLLHGGTADFPQM
ncbi:MAG TPA: low temperature requirement protein A [Mycobacteriales bacterium]|jgi:low temperature requirement protein LtrA|nr:low temperature requirement protein A [Mycobacteriales bacterium]